MLANSYHGDGPLLRYEAKGRLLCVRLLLRAPKNSVLPF